MLEDRQCVADASPGKRASMNIAYLCADRGVPVLGDKGASVHVREFATALAGMGHEITLLCANRGTGNCTANLASSPATEDWPHEC